MNDGSVDEDVQIVEARVNRGKLLRLWVAATTAARAYPPHCALCLFFSYRRSRPSFLSGSRRVSSFSLSDALLTRFSTTSNRVTLAALYLPTQRPELHIVFDVFCELCASCRPGETCFPDARPVNVSDSSDSRQGLKDILPVRCLARASHRFNTWQRMLQTNTSRVYLCAALY